MGCCEQSQRNPNFEILRSSLSQCIKSGNMQKFQVQFTQLQRLFRSNEPSINYLTFYLNQNNRIELNALGLALAIGNLKAFKFLIEKLSADPSIMESLFSKYNICGLHLICSQNHYLFFEYYSPIYFSLEKPKVLFFNNTLTNDSQFILGKFYSPVQVACVLGHISVCKSIMQFNKSSGVCHPELDFERVHEVTGENCAILSCKSGNYSLIKFIYNNQLSDFRVLNYNNESALQVLCTTNALNGSDCLSIFQFLCEKTNVDYFHNYQEVLLVIRDKKTLEYFLDLLRKKNAIEVDLLQLEKEVMSRSIKGNNQDIDTSKHFDFFHLFPELLQFPSEHQSFNYPINND